MPTKAVGIKVEDSEHLEVGHQSVAPWHRPEVREKGYNWGGGGKMREIYDKINSKT